MWAFNDLSCQWLAVRPSNALERPADKRGSRLTAAPALWPAAQLGR